MLVKSTCNRIKISYTRKNLGSVLPSKYLTYNYLEYEVCVISLSESLQGSTNFRTNCEKKRFKFSHLQT